jgi:hypothetical protein
MELVQFADTAAVEESRAPTTSEPSRSREANHVR